MLLRPFLLSIFLAAVGPFAWGAGRGLFPFAGSASLLCEEGASHDELLLRQQVEEAEVLLATQAIENSRGLYLDASGDCNFPLGDKWMQGQTDGRANEGIWYAYKDNRSLTIKDFGWIAQADIFSYFRRAKILEEARLGPRTDLVERKVGRDLHYYFVMDRASGFNLKIFAVNEDKLVPKNAWDGIEEFLGQDISWLSYWELKKIIVKKIAQHPELVSQLQFIADFLTAQHLHIADFQVMLSEDPFSRKLKLSVIDADYYKAETSLPPEENRAEINEFFRKLEKDTGSNLVKIPKTESQARKRPVK